jgi:Flp pilus assembly protein TadG
MPHSRRTSRRQAPPRSGVATVEFAFVLPILLTLLLGIWEVGRMVQVSLILHNAAREAARQASTGTASMAEIKTNIQAYVTSAEPRITNFTGFQVLFNNITRPGDTDPADATQLDRFTVTVSIPFDNVRWSLTKMFVAPGTTATATVVWHSMRDLPVTVSPGIPVE